jgi:ABC-2 type transport system permease protein
MLSFMPKLDNFLLSLHRVSLVGQRVIRQVKRDRRSIVFVIISPIILMILLGYSLSSVPTGIELGIVEMDDGVMQRAILKHLQSSDTFYLTFMATESEAEKLILEGMLDGAVILQRDQIRLLLDGTNQQVVGVILAQVEAGLQKGTIEIMDGLSLRGTTITLQDNVPTILTRYIYGYDLEFKDSVGPALLGISIFFFTFLTTTISFLRERLQGTLEKVMASPLSKVELVAGYVLGFSLIAFFQSAITFFVMVLIFEVPMRGSLFAVFVVIVLVAAGALSLGAFLSNFARSEFQVIQFIPLVIVPQIILSGVWMPLQSIPGWLRPISYILPLTYSNHALRMILLKGAYLADIIYPDILALSLFFILTFTLAVKMLQREVI